MIEFYLYQSSSILSFISAYFYVDWDFWERVWPEPSFSWPNIIKIQLNWVCLFQVLYGLSSTRTEFIADIVYSLWLGFLWIEIFLNCFFVTRFYLLSLVPPGPSLSWSKLNILRVFLEKLLTVQVLLWPSSMLTEFYWNRVVILKLELLYHSLVTRWFRNVYMNLRYIELGM